MALLQEIQVPLLAVNDTTLTVVEISFTTGSKVNKGDLIMVFETSKTTYDVEAEAEGYIHYLCEADHDYEVNEIVARIYSEAAEVPVAAAGGSFSAAGGSNRQPVAGQPTPGQPGFGQPVPGQNNFSQHAPGQSFPVLNGNGNQPAYGQAPIGQPVGQSFAGQYAGQPVAGQYTVQPLPGQDAAGQPLAHWGGETLFSAEAAALITASGLTPAAFAGRDFISKWDVMQVLQGGSGVASATGATGSGHQPATGATNATGPAASGAYSTMGAASGHPAAKTPKTAPAKAVLPADPAKVILEKLTSGKKREIEYLSDVQSTGLTSTLHIFIETENIFTHINRSLKYLKDSLLPVIIYEAARLLSDYPLLNAYFTGEAIARYKEVNPGFAIDIDKGLKVLKIARADQKGIPEIEAEILKLSGDYLDDTLQVEDLTDITFTITDLSSEGVALFRPLINKMNSSILGISSIDEKLRRCTLSLTFDHRVTEGKTAARFLKELKDRLESYRAGNPAALLQTIACFKCYKTLKEDLAGTGFAHCVTPEGKEGYICQSCLKGF